MPNEVLEYCMTAVCERALRGKPGHQFARRGKNVDAEQIERHMHSSTTAIDMHLSHSVEQIPRTDEHVSQHPLGFPTRSQ